MRLPSAKGSCCSMINIQHPLRSAGYGLRSPHLFRYIRSTKRITASPKAALMVSAKPDGGATINLDFYALLQVSPVASKDGITKAFERCVDETPAVGYSAKALEVRANILRSSYETLLSTTIRREYDQRRQQGEISEEIPSDFIPGILILLQEIREYETVITLGESWLAANNRHSSSKDVAMAVALSHVDAARTTLDDRAEDKGIAEKADTMLRAARDVLKRNRAAPKLQSQITEGLAELAPRLAFELISRPLNETAARIRGLALLPEILAGPAAPPSVGQRPSPFRTRFLKRLRNVLTPAEQAQLMEVAGSNLACSPSELYNVAVALVADGCASEKPSQLHRAAQMLRKAEAEAAPGEVSGEDVPMLTIRRTAEERNRRAVALSVCLLLLGDTEGSAEALGLGDPRPKCDRQVLAFIKTNSPDRNDLLPGMCVLTQRWVQDVVFASFRGLEKLSFTLDAWFGSPQVKQYIASASATASSKDAIAGAVGSIGKILAAPVAILSGAVGKLVASLQGGPSGSSPQDTQENATSSTSGGNPGDDDVAVVDIREGRRARDLGVSGTVPPQRTPPVPAGPPVTYNFMKTEEEPAVPAASVSAPPPSTPVAAPPPPERQLTQAEKQLEKQWAQQQARRAAAAAEKQRQAAAAATKAAQTVIAAEPSGENPFLKGINGKLADLDDADEENTNADVPMSLSEMKPLGGEDDWMRTAYEPIPINWTRILTLAGLTAVAAVVAVAAARHPASPFKGFKGLHAPVPATSGVKTSSSGTETVAPLSANEAAAVIKKWQSIKAAALGKAHAIDDLSKVLRGGVLKQWKAKAQDTKAKGWHYKHNVVSSKVLSVVPLHGDKASVKAGFKEEVTLHKGQGSSPQTFTTDYTVTYTLAKEGRDWVITGSQVQTTSS